MLAELLHAVVGLSRQTTAVAFHTSGLVPRKLWVQHGDDLQQVDADPPMRMHQLAGLVDLIAALKDKAIARCPEVYVGGGQVIALLDRADRRDRITVDLVESARFKLCGVLQERPSKTQPKDLVKLLKLEFHGGNHNHVTQALSRIDFVRTSAGRTDVAHGRESLGRSVEAQVQQADQVPERFSIQVPIWTTNGFCCYTANVEFGLHLDLEAQLVELRVLSDECARVRNQTLGVLADDLRAELDELQVPVFLGQP